MFPNQKTVVIDNDRVNTKSGRQYMMIYTSDVQNAALKLNGTAFKVYMYFAGLSDGFRCEYSPKHIQKAYGVSEDSARDAIKELTKNGFLIKQDEGTYIFRRNPDEVILQPERRIFVGASGKTKELTIGQVRYYMKKQNKKISEEEIQQTWQTAPLAGTALV